MKLLCNKMISLNISVLLVLEIMCNMLFAFAASAGNSILYIGNGGTTSEDETYYYQSVENYSSVTVLNGDIFENPKQYFLGWTDESGNWYEAGKVYSLNSNTVLTAQWGCGRITYHSNYPDKTYEDESEIQYIFDYGYIKEASMFAAEGHSFVGWNTSSDGTGKWYYEGYKVEEIIGQTELYAQWIKTPQKYLRYYAAATNVLSGKTYHYVELESFPKTVILENITDEQVYGWEIMWSDYEYCPGDEYIVTKNTTVYPATVSDITYTVVYYGNGGEEAHGRAMSVSNHSLYLYDSFMDLYGAGAFTNNEKKQLSWNTKADGTGDHYELCGRVTKEDFNGKNILKLYAQWEEALKYDINNDEVFDYTDLKIIIDTLAGVDTSEYDTIKADLNNDNKVTLYDLNKLMEYIKN